MKLNNPKNSSPQAFGVTPNVETDPLISSVRKENVELKENLDAVKSDQEASEDLVKRFEAEVELLHGKLRKKDFEVQLSKEAA